MSDLRSLRLEDYSDRELLLVVRDLAGGDGWVDAADVAQRLGIKATEPRRSVISRFVWMVRYGAMRREVQTDEMGVALVTASGRIRYGQRWALTQRGEAMAVGKLNKTEQAALARLDDEQLLLVTRYVTERQRTADDVAATLIRREWRYGTSALRSVNGSR